MNHRRSLNLAAPVDQKWSLRQMRRYWWCQVKIPRSPDGERCGRSRMPRKLQGNRKIKSAGSIGDARDRRRSFDHAAAVKLMKPITRQRRHCQLFSHCATVSSVHATVHAHANHDLASGVTESICYLQLKNLTSFPRWRMHRHDRGITHHHDRWRTSHNPMDTLRVSAFSIRPDPRSFRAFSRWCRDAAHAREAAIMHPNTDAQGHRTGVHRVNVPLDWP